MTRAKAITTTSALRLAASLVVGLFFSFASSLVEARGASYTEEERLEMYTKRGHTFPFPKYIPETPGWRAVFDRRFAQVRALKNSQMRWDGWIRKFGV